MTVNGILCTRATNHPETGTDIIGALTSLMSEGVPTDLHLTGYYQIELTPKDFENGPNFNFQLCIQPPDGNILPVATRLIHYPGAVDRTTVQELAISTPGAVLIEAFGIYKTYLLCNGLPLLTLSFQVVQVP